MSWEERAPDDVLYNWMLDLIAERNASKSVIDRKRLLVDIRAVEAELAFRDLPFDPQV